MSVFASDMDSDEHVRRTSAVGGGDSDFLAERPDLGGGANLIEEEDSGDTERTFSDGRAQRTEESDHEIGGGEPLIGEGDAGGAMPAAASAIRPARAPGLMSRAWSGIKRGFSSFGRGLGSALSEFGFGRLFGNRRGAPDPSDPGAAAEARARRDYQASGGRTVDDSRLRQVVGSRRPWMARLFGAGTGGRGSADAAASEARLGAETEHMRGLLQNRPVAPGKQAYQASGGGGPLVPFMNPTPNKVGYGEGRNKESHPVGYTPNSAWAVPAHGQAPSEQLGARRGVSKSGSMPGDALTGLQAARRAAEETGEYVPPGRIRGNDFPELRASAQERRLKARRVAGDLTRVNPQAGADYRMFRTGQKVTAAIGGQNLIPEAREEFEEDEE
jgi:hypothetical protein